MTYPLRVKQKLSHRLTKDTAPRLLVLLADLVITVISFSCAWLLRFNLDIDPRNWQTGHLLLLLGVRLFVFLALRSYAGIIRHTGPEDALRVVQTILLSNALAWTVSVMLWQQTAHVQFYVPASILFIDFFISIVLMVGSRFVVKYLYQFLVRDTHANARPVMIYGAGQLGIHTKSILLNDPAQQFKVMGFIDDNPKKVHNTVHGLPVYDPQTALVRLQAATVGSESAQVIIAIGTLTGDTRKRIIDQFLPHKIQIRETPSVSDWVNGEFSPRQIRPIQVEDLLGRPAIRLDSVVVAEQLGSRVVLVTGAAGSIGSELVRQVLSHRPAELVLLDQAESALYDLVFNLRQSGVDALRHVRLTTIVASVTDRDRMYQIMQAHQPSVVYHAAAYKHVPLMEDQPYEAVHTNVFGTKNVADLSVEFGVEKFIMVSTDKAVNPTNVMGATKRLAEMYVQSLNEAVGKDRTRFIVTRFGNVLGSNGSVVPLFRKQIEAGGPVTVTHPDIIRYFMTIPEACQLVLDAGAMGQGGEVFVFDMGQPVKILDLARQMIRLSGFEPDREIKINFSGLRPGEKLYEELLTDAEETLPTHHPKIMVARLVCPGIDPLRAGMTRLRQQLRTGNALDLVIQLQILVPEFASNNPVFVQFDQPVGIPIS
jgi:FlaA1/EpsC-like NDP-sugar epimerase